MNEQNAESVPVRVRMVFEGEYDIQLGSEGYGGATDLLTCIEIDRTQFLNDDTHLLLAATNAEPVSYELIDGSRCNEGGGSVEA